MRNGLFKQRPCWMAVMYVCAMSSHGALAGDNESLHIEIPAVAVTANPLGNATTEISAPVTVLNNTELRYALESTLGETLNNTPGVHSSYFGPNASRPVIRGLDGDRIRLMQNGVGMIDASSLSQDHAVPIDPLVIEQIDVVRGPAALQYGGSAVGGVVNTIDNRIPKDAINGVTGRAETRFGGADSQRSGAAVVEAGNGSIAIHADAYKRESSNLEIPGFARSASLRAADPQAVEARDKLPNSAAEADGGALGASITFDDGYAGLAYSAFNSTYGTVAEPNVTIDMNSARVDGAAEIENLQGAISKIKLRFAHVDYEHKELDSGITGTKFTNKGWESSIEATHAAIGAVRGVVGLQLHNTDFGADGDEALIPKVNNKSEALYVLEELPLTLAGRDLKLSAGGRMEWADVSSAGGGPDDPNFAPGTPRFGAASSSSFKPSSFSMGALYHLNPAWSLASNLSHTERAPAYYELYTNGPHVATGQYEIGDKTLTEEKSNGLDVQVRWQSGPHQLSLTGFYTKFQNYITPFNTGNTRGVDGELNPVDLNNDGIADGSGAEILPESAYRAVPAVFKGFELEGKFRIYEAVGSLDLKLKGDYVRATNSNTGEPLPRISPLRLGAGLDYRINQLGLRLDVTRTFEQDRVAANELPTDGYTMVNANLNYHFSSTPHVDAFIKATNLLNEDAREHTSVLKDISPLGGRAVIVGLHGEF